MHMTRRLILALAIAAAVAVPAAQQPTEKIDADVNAKIRKEGMDHSQILRTMHHLTDVYGPRLTGSPNHKAAAEWAVKEMTRWGFANGHLEPFDFGREGWLNEKASGHILSPVKDNLVFEVLAWTPSTNGTARGKAVHLVTPNQPTQADLTAYLEGLKPRIKGAIVLVGPHQTVQRIGTRRRLRNGSRRGGG